MTMPLALFRKLACGALCIGGTFAFVGLAGHEVVIVLLPIVLLLVSAAAIHSPKFGPQLLARAVWWSNLALGVALSVIGSSKEQRLGTMLAVCCGTALLVVGRKGLAQASEAAGYAPAAFRSSLLLLMVFALADAQTFLLFGIVSFNRGGGDGLAGPIMVLAGIAYVVAFIGLYRLAIWGALVSLGTSAVCLTMLLMKVAIMVDSELRMFLALVTFVQCLTAAPMLIAVLRGKTLPTLSARWREIGASAVIAGLMALSLVSYVRGY